MRYVINVCFSKTDKQHYIPPPPPTPQKKPQQKNPKQTKAQTKQKQNPPKKETGHTFMENLASPPSQPLQVKDALQLLLMIFTATCGFFHHFYSVNTVKIDVKQKFPALDPLQHIFVDGVHVWNKVALADIHRKSISYSRQEFLTVDRRQFL